MRNKPWECPVCYWQMFDCQAYDYGICIALTDVNFKRGRCPFFKSRNQVMLERLKARERKKRNEK